MKVSRTSTLRLSLSMVLLAVTVDQILGQTSTTGAITGKITDPQGLSVPGAAVEVTNLRTNEMRSVQTTEAGDYNLLLLSVGDYKIVVSANGFATLVRSPISVRVTEKVTVNAILRIQQEKGSVTVSAGAELVQRASPTVGGVVGPQTIVGLPLATRNYTQLMILSPGVSTSVPNAGSMGLNSIELSSQGGRASDNSILINGIDSVNIFTNTLGSYVGVLGVAVPAPDTLEEFKVQTALYSASTGRNAGANIAVITKSGTNDFHGGVYEFLRNDALNANDFFFNRAGLKKGVLKQNQFGATLGGPIQKDKVFFFGSYQGTIQRNGLSADSQSIAFLPLLSDDRSSASLGRTFGGQRAFSAFSPGGLGTAVAADGSNINPVALALLNYKLPSGQFLIPSPQTPSGLTQFSSAGRFTEHQLNANLERQFSSGSRLSGRYFYSRQESVFPLYRDVKANVLPGFSAAVGGKNHNLSLNYTHLFAPTLINEARLGFTRFDALVVGEEPVKVSDIGMTTAPGIDTLPWIQVSGMFSIGATHNSPQGNTTNLFSFADSLSYVNGRHSLQFGTEIKRHRSYAFTGVTNHADLQFLDFPSFLLGQSAAQNGAPFSHVAVTIIFAGTYERDLRATDVGSFVQDNIRISPRLSLNLGLRHEYLGTLVDAAGRNSNFDFRNAVAEPPPAGTLSGYVVGKDTQGNFSSEVLRANNNSLRDSIPTNLGPRVGFAYQPFARLTSLVLRGGYGIYFSRGTGIGIFQNVVAPPFAQFNVSALAPGSTSTFQNPLPPILPSSAFPFFPLRFANSAQSFQVQDPDRGDPYTQHFSLNLQYELNPNYLLEVGYVGTKGTHILGNPSINQALLASPQSPVHGITTNTVQNRSLRVPFQGIAPNIVQYTNGFDSNYHAAQVSMTKRFSHGFQFTGAYTFAKGIDNVNQSQDGVFLSHGGLSGDQHDFSQARGLSGFDRRHRWVFSAIWQIPKTNHTSPFVRALVNDWQVSSLITLQAGLPLTITDSAAATIFGVTTSRAQFAGDGSDAAVSGSVTDRLSKYFNTSAFTTAPRVGDGTGFGNSGRGVLRGPDQRNLDFAVFRRFSLNPLRENSTLEFRAEAFNFTNTPSFGLPGTNRATPASFGVISGTTINPRILQFALKFAF